MDDDTEVIKQQMAQTRASLAEKVEALESKVMVTVQGASDSVSAAVESVSAAVESVSDTVSSVQDSVVNTVASVKETVSDTVDSVKDAVDITGHVQRHPWAMVLGSMAVGFVGGMLLPAPRRHRRGPRWSDLGQDRGDRSAASATQYATQSPPAPKEPGWWDDVMQRFEPAIDKLKDLAIGATTSVVSELIMKNVPQHLHADVSSVIDQFSSAIVGQPASPAPSSPPPAYQESNRPHNRLATVKGNGRTS